jgi:hypothetical protein
MARVMKAWLARVAHRVIVRPMFLVTEAVADTIRAVFAQDGELAAAIELRRLFRA